MSREYPCVYWDNGICQKHTDAESLSYCVMGPCPDETPSRADYIRSMTDEEMAAWYCGMYQRICLDFAKRVELSAEIRFEDNKEQVLAYLQQPLAEEER